MKFTLKFCLNIFIVTCLSLQILNAQTYIKISGSGTGSGVDWDNAMAAAFLKSAVEAGDTVYVAAGTYSPPTTLNLSVNVSHLIQGGFPVSATGTDLSGYDPIANPTIIRGRDVIQIFNNTARVDSIHLKGLILQEGSAVDGSAFSSTYVNSSFPIDYKFTDLIVQNNVATGKGSFYLTAKTNSNTKVSFLNCNFNNNNAANGGGIHMELVRNSSNGATAIPGNLVIDGCTFEDNTADGIGGGALYILSSHAWIIKNTDFCSNVGTNARGGAIYMRTSGSHVIDSCFFSNNTTNEFGGAIDASASCSASISNSMFVENSASLNGGAISASVSTWELDNTHFYNNSGTNGGAINSTSWYAGPDQSTANNCIFFNNEASGVGTVSGTNGGGALLLGGSASFPNGWDIDSCTFVDNKAHAASWGGAISHGGIIETTITNSLFYNNTKGGNAAISGSDIKNLDGSGGFYIMSGNKMQLVNAAAYDNQNPPTDASSYAFTDDTFLNTDDGSVPVAPISPCLTEFNITGTIFEDINYGGGDGRDFTTADAQASGWSSIGLTGVTVELYDNAGAFVKDTFTNTTGEYTFLNLPNGNYSIRVVNNTITSIRASNGTGEIIIPVQTFRTDGTTNVINEVGGANPALVDTIANSASTNLSTLTSATAAVQSLTPITVLDNHTTGVDFGFNFDVIVNVNDSGQGSLRQFILNSNELDNANLNQQNNPPGGQSFPKELGWEVSLFMIPGAGVHTITPFTQLPYVEDARTEITGYTQNGSDDGDIQNRTINIELDGNTTAFDGIVIRTDSINISGLAVHDFRRGLYASISGVEEIFIWGNYIGMEADGITPSINDGAGIHLYQTVNAYIGTNGDNDNDADEGNLLSNSNYGVQLVGVENVLVAGNYIGTDKTGMVAQGNLFGGISAGFATFPNYIGFKDGQSNTDPNQFRNIISGNGINGIIVQSNDSLLVSGNYIGTDALGTGALFNSGSGIQINGTSDANVIGTNSNGVDDVLERNIIVGFNGISFASGASGNANIVAGNYIGTDYSGLASLSGNIGINLQGTFTNTIIGTNGDNIYDNDENNIISGHLLDGIRINNNGTTTIAGNAIGLAADWLSPLGNQRRGINSTVVSSNKIIGWAPSMVNTDELIIGNRIKHNVDSGIAIEGTGVNNRISRNQIANNGGLGITLDNTIGDFSVTPNDDGDTDTGENDLLNFPVIDSVYLSGNDMTVTGFTRPGTTVEFYITDSENNPNPLPPGYTSSFGEGTFFIDAATEGTGADADASTATYTDDGTGAVTTKTENRFQFTFDVTGKGLSENIPITSLAIDPSNNTSAFGNIEALVLLPPEICNDGVDNDGDGDIDCADVDCNTTYYAVSQTNTSVALPANILGAPDGQEASFGASAQMILDLGSALDIGEDYLLTLRYLFGSANIIIEESIDGVNYFAATNSPYTISASTLTDITFTTNVHTRYLRLSPEPGDAFAIDAVTYGNCLCTPATTMTEEYQIDFGTFTPGSNVTVPESSHLRLEFVGSSIFDNFTFIWTGPNSYYQVTDAGIDRDRIDLSNIQSNQAGEYKVVYFDPVGCVDSTTFTVNIATCLAQAPILSKN